MIKRVSRQKDISNIGYCKLGFYIVFSKNYYEIDNFMNAYNNAHKKFGANEEQYFVNLDDAENCLKELMFNEEFAPYFMMEKLTS